MGIIDNAVTRALEIAADDSHGYDQSQRWGPDDEKTDSGLLTEDEKTDSGLLTEDAREIVDPTGWLLSRFTTVT